MKNINKKPLYSAIFLIAIILTALGVRLWALERSYQIEGPANIRTGPDGLVYIVTDTMLYIHDQDGDLDDVIPVARFGLEKARGDFWVFNNGDLLLRRDTEKKLSCKRELETFFRTGSSRQDKSDSDIGILQRCNVSSNTCKPFGQGNDAFKKIGAFKVFVDEAKGDVYITDTPAHQLLLYDLNGELKRKSDAVFLYPNGIVRGDDGLLYIADTNHHRIAAVDSDYDTFGRIERQFSIFNMVGPPQKVWPFALRQDRNGRWWVINADNGMVHGDLVIYDNSGQVFKHVELPDNADPTEIAVLDNRVLVTDPSLMRVYSIGLNGELQEDFGSMTLKLDNAEKLRAKNLYESLSAAMLYVILVGAVAAIIIAWKAQSAPAREGQATTKKISEKTDTGSVPSEDVQDDIAAQGGGGDISVPRLPALQGWVWLSDALQIAKNSSRIYVVLFLVGLLRWQGILKIPKVGYLALLLVTPLITGCLMILSRMVVVDNAIKIKNMKLRPHIADLLFVGGAYCLILVVAALTVQLITGRSATARVILGMSTGIRRITAQGVDVSFLIAALFLLFVVLALAASTWFAPPLIVFKRINFKKAMLLSFKAVVRNFRAFNLFSIVLCGIFVVFAIAMFVIPSLIFIPLGLMTFVKPVGSLLAILFVPAIAPILTLSVYTSYVRVFESENNVIEADNKIASG